MEEGKDRKVASKKRAFLFPASSADIVSKMLKRKHLVDVDTKLYGSNVTYTDGETVVTLTLHTIIKFTVLLAICAGVAWAVVPDVVQSWTETLSQR